jgi:hypothetical protein
MCDYSLHNTPNRLANEGERLVVYRFQTGTIGLTAETELQKHKAGRSGSTFWQKLLNPGSPSPSALSAFHRERNCWFAICPPHFAKDSVFTRLRS